MLGPADCYSDEFFETWDSMLVAQLNINTTQLHNKLILPKSWQSTIL